jgi:hypothetical protein
MNISKYLLTIAFVGVSFGSLSAATGKEIHHKRFHANKDAVEFCEDGIRQIRG